MSARHRLLALFLAVVAALRMAHAVDSVPHLTDYHHTMWGAQQGAPGDIGTMTQTRDGWLWLGTSRGLYRFDGVRFEKFAPESGPPLLSAGISNVWAADNGDLWIGYHADGMSILHDGRLRHIAGMGKDSPIGATYLMEMDRDGSMWVATTKGLRHYIGGKWEIIGPASGFPGPNADSIFIDHDGRLWVSNDKRIYQLDRGTGRFIDSGIDATADDLAESSDGRLWLGEKGTWRVLPAPPTGRTPLPSSFHLHTGRAGGMFDRMGNHWQLRCPVGVCRTRGTPAPDVTRFKVTTASPDHFDQPWQMGDLAVQTMLEDREGNIWMGTQAGLERLRYKKLLAADMPSGETYFQIAKDAQGQVWAATRPGALLFKVGADGPPEVDRTHVHMAIGTATDGSFMLADTDRLERRQAGERYDIPLPPGPDGKDFKKNFPLTLFGNVEDPWLGIASRGLFHLDKGKWINGLQYGIDTGGVRAAAAGHARDIWLAQKDGGIMHVEDNGRWILMPPSGVGNITLLDARDRLVAGGDKGLAFWRDGQFHAIHVSDADVLKGVSGIMIDPKGDRWINGSKGVVHVMASDWNAMVSQPDTPLRYELFDVLDGYPGSAQTMVFGSSALQDRTGKIWFIGSGRIVSVDPRDVRRNTLPPPVVLTGLHTPRVDYPAATGQQLPAGTNALRFSYTALSYVMPERLRFEYRLDGVDTQWVAAGNVREADYRQLDPGTYRFHVRATNEEGIQSVGDVSTAFTIEPTFAQTLWFKLLVAATIAALLYAVYAWRMHRLARYYDDQMTTRLGERERIARELHDTLLQSVQGLVLKVHGTSQRMETQDPLRGMLDDALTQAEKTIADGRRRVQDLRTHEDGSQLVPLLQAAGNAWARENHRGFTIDVTGEQRLLSSGVGSEVLAICREAMSNAFQHAQCSEVAVTVTFGTKAFGVTVADDGMGIPPETMAQGGRAGHFGLTGMRERATRIGGAMTIAPRTGGGTVCTLTLPAALAYTLRHRRWWR